MRRRWVWSPELKQLVEIDLNARTEQRAPLVIPDIPDYVSPVTGKLVSGRKQRREDLLKTNSRPYEGFASEKREADRRVAYAEQASERKLEERLRTVYHQRLTPEQRRAVEGR